MNELERNSGANRSNYKRYLKRMTESVYHSSKELLPEFARGCSRILDVGCGSGVLLAILSEITEAELVGIDINGDAVAACNKTLERCRATVSRASLEEISEKILSGEMEPFDCVIFSSVLHEFSSYCENYEERFTERPIASALLAANSVLSSGGTVIIRDGLKGDDTKVSFCFCDQADTLFAVKFNDEYHRKNTLEIHENMVCGEWKYIKEFLCTYTWGEESWKREIREQYGILTKEEWINTIEKSGLKIQEIRTFAEEYSQYLDGKIIPDKKCSELLEKEIVIIITAKKQ